MNYVIFDMEWNQARSKREALERDLSLAGEIIEIGAVKVDEQMHFIDTFRVFVKPKFFPKMNRRVSRLTGITDEDLENALPLPKAIRLFKRFCGRKFAFFTWGNDDIKMLIDNMALYDIDSKWIPESYNLQIMFDMQIANEHRQCALSKAMEMVNERPFSEHDALNDAENTVLVMRHLDLERGFREYASYHAGTPKSCSGKHRIRFSDNALEPMKLPKIKSFKCPACESDNTATCESFTEIGDSLFVGCAACENGHEHFVRVRLHPKKDGWHRRWATRSIYPMDEEKRILLAEAQPFRATDDDANE